MNDETYTRMLAAHVALLDHEAKHPDTEPEQMKKDADDVAYMAQFRPKE